MKTFCLVLLAVASVCLVTMAQTPDATKQMIALEKSLDNAFLHGDWKAIETLYADDMMFTNADGSITHKKDDVDSIKSGDLKFESLEMSDVRVQYFGNVAVITSQIVGKSHYKTTDLSGTYRLTDVWAKRNGKWQLVAGHETLVPPAK